MLIVLLCPNISPPWLIDTTETSTSWEEREGEDLRVMEVPLEGQLISSQAGMHNGIIWRALENTEARVSPPENLIY